MCVSFHRLSPLCSSYNLSNVFIFLLLVGYVGIVPHFTCTYLLKGLPGDKVVLGAV